MILYATLELIQKYGYLGTRLFWEFKENAPKMYCSCMTAIGCENNSWMK